MDRLEEVWVGMYSGAPRLRCFRKAEELPCQGGPSMKSGMDRIGGP
jgi:hypothetical protein